MYSGIIVSRTSMTKLVERREEVGTDKYDKDWDSIIEAACCGDVVLAQAFLDAGVSLTPSWPLTQGENVQTLDWTERHWCVAPVTWHHMFPAQIDSIWHLEADWISKNVRSLAPRHTACSSTDCSLGMGHTISFSRRIRPTG